MASFPARLNGKPAQGVTYRCSRPAVAGETYREQEAVRRRANELYQREQDLAIAFPSTLRDAAGGGPAGEALVHFLRRHHDHGHRSPQERLDQAKAQEPDLYAAVLDWWRAGESRWSPADPGPPPAPLAAQLAGRYHRVRAGQVQALSAAVARRGDVPVLYRMAAQLAGGRLLDHDDVDQLHTDADAGGGRGVLVDEVLADHRRRRGIHVAEQLRLLSRWQRRRADPHALAAAYDAAHLLVCVRCAVPAPRAGEHGGREVGDGCPHCRGVGVLADPATAAAAHVSLAQLVTDLH